MSSILTGAPFLGALNGSVGKDGVRRYKTRCKIMVDSHNAESGQDPGRGTSLLIQDDVYSVETSKTIKGAGQATVSLIPSENYLNLIFPNDYINIYFDIGDGSGWTRTFFGFVDRIEENYSVSGNGNPTTTFRLVCTDFYKAFDRTQIYFNPQLANRPDFANYDFAEANIGGLSLMTRGIVAGGSPPDVITNLILLLIGFGTQFRLPATYNPGDTQVRLRKRRAELVYGKLSPEALESLAAVGNNYEELETKARADATDTWNLFQAGKIQKEDERIQLLEKNTNKDAIKIDSPEAIQVLQDIIIREQLTPNENERGLTGGLDSLTEANISQLKSISTRTSFLTDILDVFTFVERRSIDGYMIGYPVWQKQGSLMQILRAFSNESINEMFFDLRPLSSSGADHSVSEEPVEGAYARIADDKRGNIDSDQAAPPGITYIPALVMREYPFGTIEGLDLTNVKLELQTKTDTVDYIGPLFFGSLFDRNANSAGRHIIRHDNINIADKAESALNSGSTVKGRKHLDVAVISETEVLKTALGRSDNDHFNLFEFWSDDVLGSDNKFYMKDMLPIITPIHIIRNGIRVNTVTTRAARFSVDAISKTTPPSEHPTADETSDTIPEASVIQSPIWPSDPTYVRYYNNSAQSQWGYRPKPKPPPASQTTGPQAWVFHQGIDITKRPLANVGVPAQGDPALKTGWYAPIPVKAIADGWVVGSFPDGCSDGYGNCVVIKHDLTIPSGTHIGIRYSVYAHLDSRAVGANPTVQKAKWKSGFASKECPGVSRGKQASTFIKRGTTVGYMGNTGFTAKKNSRFHLHFEICRDWPPRKDAVTRRIPFTETAQSDPKPSSPTGFDDTGESTFIMEQADQNSCDPFQFFQLFGINLQTFINSASTPEDAGEGEPDDSDQGGNTPEELANRPVTDIKSETGAEMTTESDPKPSTSSRQVVDGSDSRKQILRWALMQDHWYQHNLEYLSGTIQMRGAPEIRVGYRLDMHERRMSYYVEGVNHSWKFPNSMSSNLRVTRGQPNNPFPVYVYPAYEQMTATKTQRRTGRSRLATYFMTPDPVAIRRSIFLRGGGAEAGGSLGNSLIGTGADTKNLVDDIDAIEFQQDSRIATKYDEMVSPAGSYELTKRMEDDAVDENEEGANDQSRSDNISGTDGRVTNLEDPTGKTK